MEKDQAARDRYAQAEPAVQDLIMEGNPSGEDRVLSVMIEALARRVEDLEARLDDHDAYLREEGAGENTIDWAALAEADRDDPAKTWTPEDEAAHQAETPRALPHQP